MVPQGTSPRRPAVTPRSRMCRSASRPAMGNPSAHSGLGRIAGAPPPKGDDARRVLTGNPGAQQTPLPVDQAATAQVVQHIAPVVAGEAVGDHTVAIQQQGHRTVRRAVPGPRHEGAPAAGEDLAAERAHHLRQARAPAHISPRALKLTARSPAISTWSYSRDPPARAPRSPADGSCRRPRQRASGRRTDGCARPRDRWRAAPTPGASPRADRPGHEQTVPSFITSSAHQPVTLVQEHHSGTARAARRPWQCADGRSPGSRRRARCAASAAAPAPAAPLPAPA